MMIANKKGCGADWARDITVLSAHDNTSDNGSRLIRTVGLVMAML